MSTNLFPMAVTAAKLADLAQLIEEGIDPDKAVQETFKDMLADLGQQVDRVLYAKEFMEATARWAKQQKDLYAGRQKSFETALDKLEAKCKEILETNPNQPYEGDEGRIRIQKNGTPAVVYEFGDREIDQATIDLFQIDQRFYRIEPAQYYLDAKAVKDAIAAGEKLCWASLDYGTHIRIERLSKSVDKAPKLKKTKPKELPSGTTNN